MVRYRPRARRRSAGMNTLRPATARGLWPLWPPGSRRGVARTETRMGRSAARKSFLLFGLGVLDGPSLPVAWLRRGVSKDRRAAAGRRELFAVERLPLARDRRVVLGHAALL